MSKEVIDFMKEKEEREWWDSSLDDPEDVLAYRNNSAERRKRLRDRKKVNKDDETRPVALAIAAFRRELIKATIDHRINMTAFTPGWDSELRFQGNHLSDAAVNELSRLSGKEQSSIVYEILKEINDGWVKNHPDDFFGYFIDWEYYYLPVEFMEEKMLHHYYESIDHLLQNFGLNKASWEETRNILLEQRVNILKKNQVKDCISLAKAIINVCSDYGALNKKITKVMTKRKMAFDVACQVLFHNPDILRD